MTLVAPAEPPLDDRLGELDRFDQDVSVAFTKQVVNLLNDVYFRTRLVGFDAWDERSNPAAPLIYVSNHSGMALPWDAVAFVAMLFRRFGYEYDKTLRTLITPFFTRVGLLSLYQVPTVLTRSGGVEATFRNFEAAMRLARGHVLVYPEGLRGIGKGFDKRYQLQRVSTSVVRMALKYRTDIVHFASVNGEYIHPFAYRSEWLNRVGKRLLGLPFLPFTVLLPLIVLQPWVFYMAFPANLTFVRKSRIGWRELRGWSRGAAEPGGGERPAEAGEEEIRAIRDRLQVRLQAELDEAEATYGRQPFGWRSFWRQLTRHWRSFPLWLPVGWPLLFWEFERQYARGLPEDEPLALNGMSVLRIVAAQPWLLAYYVPVLGWLPLLFWSARVNGLPTVTRRRPARARRSAG